MKRLILLFTFLFTVSSSFLACKDASPEPEVAEDEVNTDVFEDEQEDDFGMYDANDDNMWDESEFAQTGNNDIAEWDADQDQNLNNDEFYNSTFTTVDRNRDNSITEDEWNEGRNSIYGDYADNDDFNLFDTDDDGMIENTEWNEGFADSEWFNSFDENDDELVDNNEWNSGLFDDWDANNDGFWDEDEYGSYEAYTNS